MAKQCGISPQDVRTNHSSPLSEKWKSMADWIRDCYERKFGTAKPASSADAAPSVPGAEQTIRVGDSVVVNKGVRCPGDPDFLLEGWQGRVTEVYPEDRCVSINWDSKTLRSLPSEYIRLSAIGGLGWEAMTLSFDEVSFAKPRDTVAETEAAYADVRSRHIYDYLSDENPGIADLLNPLGNASMMAVLRTWERHLTKTLQFPFEARVEERVTRTPVQVGDIVSVERIEMVDESYGLLVAVMAQRKRLVIPLCDLEAVDESSSNYQPLHDYVVWHANR